MYPAPRRPRRSSFSGVKRMSAPLRHPYALETDPFPSPPPITLVPLPTPPDLSPHSLHSTTRQPRSLSFPLELTCRNFRQIRLSSPHFDFFLFVRLPCAARSPAQVTWMRGRGHPTVLGTRWRSPAIVPPPIHPFFFEAVAPRKLVSQLREGIRGTLIR